MLIGQVQEIPGVVTQGANVEQVMDNIQDALGLYFQDSDVVLEKNNSQRTFKNIVSMQELEFA